MIENLSEIADTIISLEMELRRINRWEVKKPHEQKLQSQLPFCCDTLEFTQWLQWVLIPRVKFYIENNLPFPFVAQISPYADEALRDAPYETRSLVKLIAEFDKHASSQVRRH